MRSGKISQIAAIAAVLATAQILAAPTMPPEQLWQKPYAGAEAAGPQILGLWKFDSPNPIADASGRGHTLKLLGRSRIAPEGRFGSCLEVFRADKDTQDTAEGAAAPKAPALNPKGPFTVELWIHPKPEFADDSVAFLIDKKLYHYAKDTPQANTGFCIYMRKSKEGWRINAFLGFGSDSAGFVSDPVAIEPGRWQHIAFAYDAKGTGVFYQDGIRRGSQTLEGRGPVTPGAYQLVIGDRVGSIHDSFAGYIDEVRFSAQFLELRSGRIALGAPDLRGRTVFERMEQGIVARLPIDNDTDTPLSGAQIEIAIADAPPRSVSVPDIAPGAHAEIEVPIDTSLRPGPYRLTAKLNAANQTAERELEYRIVPRPTPGRMPVVMWGTGDIDNLTSAGFTHDLLWCDYFHNECWKTNAPVEALRPDALEKAATQINARFAAGMRTILSMAPGRRLEAEKTLFEEVCRIDRKGKIYEKHNTCGQIEKVRNTCRLVGESAGATLGAFPSVQTAMIHSEVRDGTAPCFHEVDRQAFRKAAGFDIPDAVIAKNGVNYTQLPGFPVDRIVPDDHPILVYYRWFWKNGDGWNTLHTLIHQGLKARIHRPDFWTYFDPAVRAPSIWGSGGEVDIISNWTYSYPDPIKIGQTTDELLAMADGRPGQQVMKMTQIIWYRSQTAPDLPKDESKRTAWEKDKPEAKFITIAPDHLREAFWSKISRPIRGIMYHGWSSLVDVPNNKHSYQYTNPQTRQVLAELVRNVIQPLGPTLLQVPDAPADVALLESFASQMFARRGAYGWGKSWEADAHLILQWAHLQPRILYEETILRDGLDNYRVLVLPGCDVLPQSVAERIVAFQARGGIVVADEFAPPAITPDVLLPSFKRTKDPQADKAALQKRAAELREAIAPLYQPPVDADSPDLVVRVRRYKNADYIFALNDRRTFGDYVGQHKLVMEKGLPLDAVIRTRRSAGHIYDLVAHQPVAATPAPAGTRIPARLAPGDGRLFLLTEQPIDRVRIEAPAQAKRAAAAKIRVTVADPEGRPIATVIPLRIDILDPQGRPAEGAGFYAATDGMTEIAIDIAPNDTPGKWTLRAQELASGQTAETACTVE